MRSKSDWQSSAVFACTPALPVASDEGRGRELGRRHMDWHNSTDLAKSALRIMGLFKLSQGLPGALEVKIF